VVRGQRGQGAHRHPHALQRLDAADEQQQRALAVESEGPTGLPPVTGPEERVIDTRRHDPDA